MTAPQEPAGRVARRYADLARAHSRHGRRRRRRGWRVWLVPALVVAGIVAVALLYLWMSAEPLALPADAAASTAPRAPAERTAALPPLNLPADDAPHGQAMEWWYHSGIVEGPQGRRYAFHVAVFVANNLIKHTVMHAALTDLQSGRRYLGQNRTAGLPSQRNAEGFDFRQEGWNVRGQGPLHHLDIRVQDATLTLALRDTAPVVAHRAADSKTPGLLDFGDSGISYYYSRPRMAASGEISLDGGPKVPVSGQVWFDHQWGDFDVLGLGWTWFALHLKDGSDVMLYELFDREGRPVITAGTLTQNGQSVALRPNEIVLAPAGQWTSPRTRVNYVVGWQLRLPQTGTLEIQPMLPDSEFDASASSANLYWEGPVRVGGSAQGHGFMELSGYERLKAPRVAR